jgi:AAA15 family ATPase/GTPase
LEILTYQGISMIHGYLKGYDEPVPSPLLGDGVRRSLSVILAVGAAENGVVLVDEIENGIHHSAMKPLWSVIAEASKTFNCQVFATTHSEECIYAAHDAFKENGPYDLMLYRLDRRNGSISAVAYDEERLDAAFSIPLEVRGWPV